VGRRVCGGLTGEKSFPLEFNDSNDSMVEHKLFYIEILNELPMLLIPYSFMSASRFNEN